MKIRSTKGGTTVKHNKKILTIIMIALLLVLSSCGTSESIENGDTHSSDPQGDNKGATEEGEADDPSEVKEGDNDLSKEVMLKVWSYSKMENTSYSDASSETVETFVELFDTLFNQEEDTEDIIVMGEESFESILDGVISCDGKSIGFLNDGITIPWENTDYENAWYLEVFISEPHELRGIILPKDSKYITVLNELLDTLNYEKIKE